MNLTGQRILPCCYSLAFICYLSGLSAQGLIDDVIRLSQAIDPTITFIEEKATTAATAEAGFPLGILAAYAYPTRKEAIEKSLSPDEVLLLYRNNPYLQPFLTDPTLSERLLDASDPDTIATTINAIRGPARERISGFAGGSDIYADNQLLDPPRLIAEYRSRRETNMEAQKVSALQLKAGATDPAALTANVLNGLAEWIGKRAREELAQTFLLRLTDNLRNKQLDLLFSSTVDYLSDLDVTNYRSMLSSARLAFADDLNRLPFSVPNYLIGKTQNNNPFILNSLLVNQMVDLSRRDIPLPSLLAQAGGNFSQRRFENEKILHDSIVKLDRLPVYKTLQSSSEMALKSLEACFDSLEVIKETLATQINNIDDKYYEAKKFLEKKGIELQVKKKEILAQTAQFSEAEDTTDANLETTAEIDEDLEYIETQLATLKEVRQKLSKFLKDAEGFGYQNLFTDQDERLFRSINYFLKGQLDYKALVERPSLESYKRHFINEPSSADTLRAIGLTMIKRLLDKDLEDYLVLNTFTDYAHFLVDWQKEIDRFELLTTATRRTERPMIDSISDRLKFIIDRENAYWAGQDKVSYHEKQSLEYLFNLAQGWYQAIGTRKLLSIYDYFEQVEQLFVEKMDSLQLHYPLQAGQSPYFESGVLSRHTILTKLRPHFEDSRNALDTLKAALAALDTVSTFKPLHQSYTTAQVFSGVLQTGAVVLSALATTEQNPKTSQLKWISPDRLSQVLDQDTPRQVFLGLLHQRLASTTAGLPISTEGLEQVISRMAVTLQGMDAITDKSARFVSRLEVASGLINTLLETPLVRTGAEDQSLVDMYQEFLGNVPAINRELTALVRHTEKREYRYGFDNVLRLIELLKVYPATNAARSRKLEARRERATSDEEKQKWTQKLASLKSDPDNYTRFRNDVFRYGQFIADIAGADHPEAVAAAFQNMAAPRGSSLNKRVRSGSIDLNAYFGGTFGREMVKDKAVDSTSLINSYGLFVPVGIAGTWRPGKSKGISLSLFLPLMDLGALTSYRTDATKTGLEVLPDVSFANVLAPGAHVLVNFPKSPLFLGGGFQFGPNVRDFNNNGQSQTVNATRLMFTFGIDVPLISFTGNR